MATYGLAQVVPGLLGLVSVPLWIRLVGAGDYGGYAVAWGVAVSAAALGTGWLRQSALRQTPAEGEAPEQAPGMAVAASVLLAAAMAAAVVTPLLQRGLLVGLLVVPYTAALAAALLTGTALQRRERSGGYAALEATRAVVGLLATGGLLLGGTEGLVALLLGATTGNLTAMLFVPRRGPGPARRHGRDVLARWWSYGWPMSIWLGLAPLLLYTDRLVLSRVVADDRLGTYAAISELVVRGTTLVGISVTMALHPAAMRLSNAGRQADADALVRRWRDRLALGLAASVVAAGLLGPALSNVLLGSTPSRAVVVLLVAAGGGWQICALLQKPLEFRNRTRSMLAAISAAAAVQLVAGYALTLRFAEEGAAGALLVGVVTYAVVVTRLAARLGR